MQICVGWLKACQVLFSLFAWGKQIDNKIKTEQKIKNTIRLLLQPA